MSTPQQEQAAFSGMSELERKALRIKLDPSNPYRKWKGGSPPIRGLMNLLDPRMDPSGYDAYEREKQLLAKVLGDIDTSFRHDPYSRPLGEHAASVIQSLPEDQQQAIAASLGRMFNAPSPLTPEGMAFTSPLLEAERAGSLAEYQEKLRAAGKSQRGLIAQERLGASPLTAETSPTEQYLAYDVPIGTTPSPGQVAETERQEGVARQAATTAHERAMEKERTFAPPMQLVDQDTGETFAMPQDAANALMRADPRRYKRGPIETREISGTPLPAASIEEARERFVGSRNFIRDIDTTLNAVNAATVGPVGAARFYGQSLLQAIKSIRALGDDAGPSGMETMRELEGMPAQVERDIAERDRLAVAAGMQPLTAAQRDAILADFDPNLSVVDLMRNRLAYQMAKSYEPRFTDQDIKNMKEQSGFEEWLPNPKDIAVRLQNLRESAVVDARTAATVLGDPTLQNFYEAEVRPWLEIESGRGAPQAFPSGYSQAIEEMKARIASGEITEEQAMGLLEQRFGGADQP